MEANIHTETHSNTYTREERESKGHVWWERSPWEVESRDCTWVPSPFAHHISTHSKSPPPPPPAHTLTRTLCPTPWKTLTSAPVCIDHSHGIRKGGKTRDGEEKYIRGSLPVAAQHGLLHRAVRAQELHSCTATHKHTRMLHQRLWDDLVWD